MAAILKWHKTGSPSDFYLMALTFDIGGGLVRKKTWSQTFMGGGCTVTLSGPWTNTTNDQKCTKYVCIAVYKFSTRQKHFLLA